MRLNRIQRPLEGLLHIGRLRDTIEMEKIWDEEDRKWVIDFKIHKDKIVKKHYLLQGIQNYTSVVYEHKLRELSEKFPNSKVVFMVKDPRAFIATRLKRARSKSVRRKQYFELMELWLKINSELIKTCDKFATICEILRYEDLVLRTDSTIGKGLDSSS